VVRRAHEHQNIAVAAPERSVHLEPFKPRRECSLHTPSSTWSGEPPYDRSTDKAYGEKGTSG
jgi:hypothetical protein